MAKSASPIRLQQDLMRAAAVTGERCHRSTAEQIEYWAEIGRQLSLMLDQDDLLAVSAGLATIKVESIQSEPIDPKTVFESLEAERAQGTLSRTVTSNPTKYQVSSNHPGYLEQINSDGTIKTGKFQQGEFIEMSETAP